MAQPLEVVNLGQVGARALFHQCGTSGFHQNLASKFSLLGALVLRAYMGMSLPSFRFQNQKLRHSATGLSDSGVFVGQSFSFKL